MLQGAGVITIPRYVCCHSTQPLQPTLIGFGDASCRAYAPVVYIRTEGEAHVEVHVLALKLLQLGVPPFRGWNCYQLYYWPS